MKISPTTFDDGAEYDCGWHWDGSTSRYRLSIRRLESNVYQLYKRYSTPHEDRGREYVLASGIGLKGLEECVAYVRKNFKGYEDLSVIEETVP